MTIQRVFRILHTVVLALLVSGISYAQVKVTGVVKDEKGETLPGVNVVVKGTTVGTITDADGKFSISVKDVNNDVLAISMVGFVTQEIPLNGKTYFEIALQEEVKKLEEVVVVGYGTVKKSDLTGAVSTVKSAELTQLATVNVQQAIQGRVAGVMVTSESGEPGAGVKVRVRGVGTINNSDPLYVVDGFPTSDISHISPSDIESMEILKDASATAIYGNRGANGVVLITTRKGKEQKTVVNFNMYTGVQTFNHFVPVLNATEYAQARLLATQNRYSIDTIGKTPAQKANIKLGDAAYDSLYKTIIANNYKGTDWQKEVMQQGAVNNYSLGISGGAKGYTYDLTGTYYREDGVVKNSWLKKYFLRFANQYQFSERVKGEAIISYTNTEKTNYDYGLYSGILPLALVAEPVAPVYQKDTNQYAYLQINETANPVAKADRMANDIWKSERFVGNFSLEVKLLEGLTFTTKNGVDLRFDDPSSYNPSYYIGPKDQNSVSSLYINKNKGRGWNTSNYFNYNTEFGKSSLSLMAGQEASYGMWLNTEITVYGVPEEERLRYVSNASGTVAPKVNPIETRDPFRNYEGEVSLLSYFGRVNYSYDGKYLFTASIRRDGSSKLSKDNRWGTFPSFSVGWNLKQEAFLQDVKFISGLKLRGGYGVTGNESSVSDPYSGYIRYRVLRSEQNGEINISTYQTLFNPNLKWEITKQQNYAVDMAFFNNQLTASVDYYIRKTEDMIVQPPQSEKEKAQPRMNIGAMENSGIEFTLGYRNSLGDLKYEINGNIAFMQHPKVTKLLGDKVLKMGQVGKVGGVVWTQEGYELCRFVGYKTNGIITEEDLQKPEYKGKFNVGDLKIVNTNGDSIIDENDKVFLGSPNPDYTFGINIGLEYKGFDFKIFVQGVQGNELINSLYAFIKAPVEGRGNLHKDVLKGYQEGVRDNSTLPKLIDQNSFFKEYFTDYFVEDGSYVRIKNVQLGYTFSDKILTKVGLKSCRVYVSAENLLTFTKYSGFDPEVGRGLDNDPLQQGIDVATYPLAKKFMMGVNLNF
jgi:TonB-linked SusC/RagA family outer membrane protein